MNEKIAVLIEPFEKQPPSNQSALNIFKIVAAMNNAKLDFVYKKDLSLLKSYTSLFIRTLTSKDNYTYQWSMLADFLNLKIIDTPKGIALGSDKHLQYELCKINKIRMPETMIIYSFDNLNKINERIIYPVVLKIPNGAFSQNMYKIINFKMLKKITEELFSTQKYTSLILQEYIYTDYDWRIGILNKKILFACKYFMAPNHWQIIRYEDNKKMDEGLFETITIKAIDERVLDCVNKVINILDEGLYGLDIKIYNNHVYLIEINDNPDINEGVEDQVEKENIYQKIISQLVVS